MNRLSRALTKYRQASAIAASSRFIQLGAREQACRDISDADGCVALKAELDGVPVATIEEELARWDRRETYVDDRAYRLLVGVLSGTVPPSDPDNAEEFGREEALGRMPLSEAFAGLAALDPRLDGFVAEARGADRRKMIGVLQRLNDLQGKSEAITGELQWLVAGRYLRNLSHDAADDRPFFDQSPVRKIHGRISGTAS